MVRHLISVQFSEDCAFEPHVGRSFFFVFSRLNASLYSFVPVLIHFWETLRAQVFGAHIVLSLLVAFIEFQFHNGNTAPL
ncbi:hypothetical protein B0T26DRAFT_729524 [Lasiosphaeria miniovina]|uniref:Uncharacterized protein n=1 Tax=Lasiosphaeria miniovina TaxID=1954250 RepID=A0AA40DH69_9PEZI|nr:uncharacterized protein B0T26DRAFT_729524 [Lasiosphaeria miniovina]KAK0702995.1 hypothetical protein B0T26DRAFT_729524 [Lasiosphaeria miniovina]